MQPHGNADMELDDKGPGQYAAKGGAFSGEVGEDLLISQAENARIRWKIDLVILPCITVSWPCRDCRLIAASTSTVKLTLITATRLP